MQKLLLLGILNFLSPIVAQNPSIATATQVQTDKKVKYQFPSEFKQAVSYYIKRADNFHPTTRDIDENSAYKKELRYLLNNYGKFSVSTLLSRVRSAHQTMVTQETNSESDVYQQYEKICSALLLICAQVFLNETKSHLLDALREIDNLLVYWRYQRNHQIHYFFSKSPLKWVMGKEQAKEIVYNITRLERKQKELYTLLGSLIGHAHAFTMLDGTHQACYAWIEQLLEKVNFSHDILYGSTDGSLFDECASQLENKLKRVKNFKSECLSSLVGARKPNHFVRNWARYATLCAATAYMLRYHSQNPEVMNSAFNAVQDEASKFLILLLHPLQKIYERGKLIFSDEKKEDVSKKQVQDDENNDAVNLETQWADLLKKVKIDEKDDIPTQEIQLQAMQDMLEKADSKTRYRIEKSLKKIEDTLNAHQSNVNEKEIIEYQSALNEVETFVLGTQLVESAKKLVEVGSKIPSDHAAIIERSNADLRKGGLDSLREVVAMLKNPKDGWVWSSSYEFDEKRITDSINKIEKIVVPMKIEKIITNQKELDEYKDAFKVVKDFITQFKKDAAWTIEGLCIRGNLEKSELALTIDEDYLDPLLGYLEIIEKRIIPIFEFIVDIADNLITQVSGLINRANVLEAEATQQLKEARQQLKDHELTLMFTSLIPLGIITLGASKLYQWSISRDYSPIRIALSEVNSLLIEADNYVDDHYYGKLIYLLCKLRHKSNKLKDSMANEFLEDVAKLESKQYSAQTKHAMVENMFNKYAFLGKVAA